jgi:hypothetical protein
MYLVDTKAPEGPYFEVAVIHHTYRGSALQDTTPVRLKRFRTERAG